MNSQHICPHCELAFESHSKKANHIRWHHTDTSQGIQRIKEAKQKRKGDLIETSRECKKCSKPFTVQHYSNLKRIPVNQYCSRSCANSKVQSESTKLKKGEKIRNHWKKGTYDNSQQQKLQTNKIFSSKIERLIVKHFKETYPNDEWKSGGGLKINQERISRDLYSDKLKVCFEYDGVWHFKDIHGQLSYKQNKDTILEEWCLEKGYRLIRVDEDSYKDITQIEDLVYKCTAPIVKIGTRYLY